jgi:hypothetical protein
MIAATRRLTRPVLTVLAVALIAGGCQDDDPSAERPEPSATTSTAPEVRTAVTFGRVTGKLPADARKRLATRVGAAVDDWADAAYLRGDKVVRGIAAPWSGFTAADATRRRVRIDTLAVHRRPVGVTAHVLLVLDARGRAQRKVRVQGRLFLTHGDGGWRVFGYDVTKGDL